MFTIPIVIIIGGFFPGIQLSVPFMDDAFSFQNVEDIVTVVWQGEFVFVTECAARLHGHGYSYYFHPAPSIVDRRYSSQQLDAQHLSESGR